MIATSIMNSTTAVAVVALVFILQVLAITTRHRLDVIIELIIIAAMAEFIVTVINVAIAALLLYNPCVHPDL